jgi:hypothetical protein
MTVRLDTRKLDRLIRENRPGVAGVVDKHGRAIASEAATKHPWKTRTGALMNSILSESKMDNASLTFIVQDGVEYGLRLELGFVGEDSRGRIYNQPAYPFIVPAVEHWRQRFYDAFTQLYQDLTK